jgi:hypothetical protein|tara:strand:- start:11 stop:352 length:342 start_codon:yes stop_codon:yes gene_type:complete
MELLAVLDLADTPKINLTWNFDVLIKKSIIVATIPTSIAAIKLKNSVTSNTLTSTEKYEISCLIFEKRPKKNDRRMFLPFASSKRNERTADTLAKTGMGNRFKNGAKNKIVAP